MNTAQITLIGKPGCHLCDDARDTIETVRAELSERGIATVLEELNILEDAELARLHAEEIPVIQVNDRRVAIWRIDAAKLTAAVEKVAPGSPTTKRRWPFAGPV